ncbi:MAG: hypothetical protein ACI4DU_02235 [Lachnospiraceae bacterium]
MGIIYDARRLKAYEALNCLCDLTGKNETFQNKLWEGLLSNEALMAEFMYYLDHHRLLDEYKSHGYSLTDLYVWQLDKYNLIRDIGKNTAACNKETIVLNAFEAMLDLENNPETYIKHMTDGRSQDRFSF